MKHFALIFFGLFIISCDNNIEGVYYVNSNRNDRVYIELVDKSKALYKVSTPKAWEEFAVLSNKTLKGEWNYCANYFDKNIAGLKGSHIAEYKTSENKFLVDVVLNNKSVGHVTWTKLKDLNRQPLDGIEIYLTFDDGPFDGTRNVLSVLKKTNIEATFFLVGKHAKELKQKHRQTLDLLKNSKKVLLANHSYSHANGNYSLFYSNPLKVIEDLDKNQSILKYDNLWKRVFKGNIEADIARLPGRNVWLLKEFQYYDLPDVKKISNQLSKSDYKIYGWDVEWYMLKGNPASPYTSVLNKIEERIKNSTTKKNNKCVILMHDRMFYQKQFRDELFKFINTLKAKGCKFKTLSDY